MARFSGRNPPYVQAVRTDKFRASSAALGLRCEVVDEIECFVTEYADQGAVFYRQKDLMLRTLRWKDRYTVLYLSALGSAEIYLFDITTDQPPPPPPNKSARLAALLEKLLTVVFVEAAKRLLDLFLRVTNNDNHGANGTVNDSDYSSTHVDLDRSYFVSANALLVNTPAVTTTKPFGKNHHLSKSWPTLGSNLRSLDAGSQSPTDDYLSETTAHATLPESYLPFPGKTFYRNRDCLWKDSGVSRSGDH